MIQVSELPLWLVETSQYGQRSQESYSALPKTDTHVWPAEQPS